MTRAEAEENVAALERACVMLAQADSSQRNNMLRDVKKARDAIIAALDEAVELEEQAKHSCAFKHQKIILGADIACPLCMAEIERDEAVAEVKRLNVGVANVMEDLAARATRAEINAKPPAGCKATSFGYYDGLAQAFNEAVHWMTVEFVSGLTAPCPIPPACTHAEPCRPSGVCGLRMPCAIHDTPPLPAPAGLGGKLPRGAR